MMEFLIAQVLLFLALVSTSLLWSFKKDRFLEYDADRCLNQFCEIEPDTIQEYERRGYMYHKGLTVIQENGKKRFVKQAKIVWL